MQEAEQQDPLGIVIYERGEIMQRSDDINWPRANPRFHGEATSGAARQASRLDF